MLETIIHFVLPFSFTLMVACALTALVSALVLYFRIRFINLNLQHPYLKQQTWERYPFSIKAAILMDYFLRLSFPKSQFWIIGQANRLMAHLDPADVPVRQKWPLIGFWGGCFVGLFAMVLLWSLVLLKMAV